MPAKLRGQKGIPSHLQAHGRRFWADMVAEYAITDRAGLALLERAAVSLDMLAAARKSIREHGVLVPMGENSARLIANPACRLERESSITFLAAMKALNLQPPENRKRRMGRPGSPVGIDRETADAVLSGQWTRGRHAKRAR